MKRGRTDGACTVSLQEYLQARHTKATAERYQRDIANYLQIVTEPKAINATYSDIMGYIEILRGKYSNPETIKVIIHSIKKYYYWLNHTGKRKTHPCRNLKLREKTNRDIQIQDLFKLEELELLLNRKERYSELKIKNQVIISLLIYQGLTRNDIVNLTLNDIDLNEGTIYIKADTKTNSRTLKLKSKQIMLLHKYITETRPKLLQSTDKACLVSTALVLTKAGTPKPARGSATC